MSKVYPIDKTQLNQAQSWMKKHADRGFWLIFRLGIETGLRVTDLTEIEWSDIDFDKRQMTILKIRGRVQLGRVLSAKRGSARFGHCYCSITRVTQGN